MGAKNFQTVHLGDKRRTRRVIDLAQKLALHPGKSIPQLFENVYPVKACYELFKLKEAKI